MTRFFDILFSFFGLLFLMPFFLIIWFIIVLTSRGGGFYKQIRVGKNGKDFTLYKFRSMRKNADKGSLITVGGRDPRITRIGYFIRRFKIDELPQLFNVFIGDMSLVGPRPEVRKYVNLYNDEQKRVLTIRPGITDYASIEYVNENEILGNAANPDEVYIHQIMPDKIRLNIKYIDNHSLKEYFKIIFLTVFKIFR